MSDLRERLIAALPLTPSNCPDPQCGDSTWDHECQLGTGRPDEALATIVLTAVAGWLRAEAEAEPGMYSKATLAALAEAITPTEERP